VAVQKLVRVHGQMKARGLLLECLGWLLYIIYISVNFDAHSRPYEIIR
jgi:hypothetical protein